MEIKIEDYFPLVKKIVKRYENLGLEKDDLFQEGCLGLIEAKKNYKEEKKVNFSVYARFWIKKHIIESIERYRKQKIYISEEKMFHLFNTKLSDYSEISYKLNLNLLTKEERKIIEEFYLKEKTLKEIADELRMSREQVRQIKQKALMKLKNFNRKLTETLSDFNFEKVF